MQIHGINTNPLNQPFHNHTGYIFKVLLQQGGKYTRMRFRDDAMRRGGGGVVIMLTFTKAYDNHFYWFNFGVSCFYNKIVYHSHVIIIHTVWWRVQVASKYL